LSITTSLQVFAISLVFCTLTIKTYTTIGVLPEEGLSLVYDQVEDLGELWTRTKEILPYKEVSDEWLKEKFGIEVTGQKAPAGNLQLSQNSLPMLSAFFD
jgi:hypothetical protein